MTKLNRYSAYLTEPKSQAASQAMLYGTGLTDHDMSKAQIGIGTMWYDGNPCNMHLNQLADAVKTGVQDAGLIGMRFNTIGVSDGISMGTPGMSYSLQSREIIADSIETVMAAHFYDGAILIPGCDKNLPACVMALARINRPGLVIYGGTIKPGRVDGRKIDIVSAFQSYGAYIAQKITEAEQRKIVANACPGPGACGGMYTANTMASAIEAMGLSLPYSASTPAVNPQKQEECLAAAKTLYHLIEAHITPKDIVTKNALSNALRVVIALGGSTNAVLHLIAIAHAFEIDFGLQEIQEISDSTPYLADIKPSGQYVMNDLHAIGGIPAVMKHLLDHGLLNGDCLTITGRSIAENLGTLPRLHRTQKIIHSLRSPIKRKGHIQILYGNLAPGGSVAKLTGKEGEFFRGPARVFDSEETMLRAVEDGLIHKGDVVVIRYEGPKGGPGMPEMLAPTAAIVGAGLASDVALVTDGRFSGGSHGFIIGHITPEAQEGGPIALVNDGDMVEIDAIHNRITLHVTDDELSKRRRQWEMPPYKAKSGTLWKYIQMVHPASDGCITDRPRPNCHERPAEI